MIIGTDKIDYSAIKYHANNVPGLLNYVTNLVPIWAQHIPGIVDNQRYYVALHFRRVLSVNYETRKAVVEALVKDIHICGSVTGFVTIKDIVDSTNKEALLEVLLNEQGDRGRY